MGIEERMLRGEVGVAEIWDGWSLALSFNSDEILPMGRHLRGMKAADMGGDGPIGP
jgi:hypothetical protein